VCPLEIPASEKRDFSFSVLAQGPPSRILSHRGVIAIGGFLPFGTPGRRFL